MKKTIVVLMTIATSLLFAGDTATEQTIRNRIDALQVSKSAFDSQFEELITTVATPMITQAGGLITESEAIHRDVVSYCKNQKLKLVEQEKVLGLVDNFIDANGIAKKKQMVDFLQAALKIAKKEFAK